MWDWDVDHHTDRYIVDGEIVTALLWDPLTREITDVWSAEEHHDLPDWIMELRR